MHTLNNKIKAKPLLLVCLLLLNGALLAAENKLEEPLKAKVNVIGEKQKHNMESIKKTDAMQNKAKQQAKKIITNNKKDSFIPTEAISEDLAVSFPTDI